MDYLPSNPLAGKSAAPSNGQEPTEEQKKAQYDAFPEEQKKKQTYTEWVIEAYNNQYEGWMPWLETQYLKWFGKGDNKASYVAKGQPSTSYHAQLLVIRFGHCDLNSYSFVCSIRLFPYPSHHLSDRTLDTLNKSKITGIKQVDQIQDDVNSLVGNQLGENGLLAPVGKMVSTEGIDRAERGGKDDKGSYGGPVAGYTDPMIKPGKSAGEGVAGGAHSGAQAVGGGMQSGAQTVGSGAGKIGEGVVGGVKGAGEYVGGLIGGGKKAESGSK